MRRNNLEKGLASWGLCINWNTELQKMTWAISSKLTDDNDPKGTTYREIEIDAVDGTLLREYYVSKLEKIAVEVFIYKI